MSVRLPNGWETSTLGEVCEINPPRKEIASLPNDLDVSFVPMAAVSEEGHLLEVKTRKLGEVKKGFPHFKEKDVLVAKITPCFENGKRWLARSLRNGIGFGSTEFHILRAKNRVLPEWIYYFISLPEFRRGGQRKMTGTAGQKRVPPSFLAEYEIAVPSVKIQEKIVRPLQRTERLREIREQANQLTNKIIQSVFVKMFGDPATNSKGWEITTIGNHATIRYGTGSPPPYEETGIPFVRATNIKMGKIVGHEMRFISAESAQKIEKCRLREGNLLIVRSGVNTGDCAYVTREYDGAYAAYDLILDSDEQLDNRFVWAILNMQYGRRIMKPMTVRAAQPHLNAGQVSSINVPKPPVELQRRFSAFVEKLDTVNERQTQSTHEISELFHSLMHKAFTGQLVA